MDERYKELFSRNIGILTEEDQEKLNNSCIAIAGVGGVGGIQLATLARTGIGKFNIADPEVFGFSDRNRQYGAKESTLGKNKAIEMEKIIKDINPHCEVNTFNKGVNSENIREFIKDADVVIDAIEYFTVDEKIRLYKEARGNNKFVFTSPIIGFGSSLLVFDPNGVTYEEYFDLNEKNNKLAFAKLCPIYPNYLDKNLYRDALNKKHPIPSFSASTALSAGLLTTEAILFLLGKRKPIVAPKCILIDYCRQSFDILKGDWKGFWTQFSKEAYDNISLLPENKKMLNNIVALVGNNKKVLDAGCGTGNLTIKLAENNDVTAIDFSSGMVKSTLEKTKGLNNVAVREGDVISLPFPDKTFDVVTSVNVFFNLDDPEKAIKEANRVLKDNGLLIVSSPLKHEGLNKDFRSKVLEDGKKGNVETKKIMKVFEFNKIVFTEGGIKFTPDYDEISQLLHDNNFTATKTDKTYYDTNFLITAVKRNET